MRVLIVRVGAMGDVLHALPAVAALRHERPEWGIDWVVDARWRALLEDGPVVNKVHVVEPKAWSKSPVSVRTLRSVMALRKRLRAERYDVVVDMQGTLRSAVIGRMAGARLVGFSDPRERVGWLYSEKVQRLAVPEGLKPISPGGDNGGAKAPPLQSDGFGERVAPRQSTHVVEQGAALLAEACGVALQPKEFALPVIAAKEHWAEEQVVKQPMCVLSAGGGWGAKLWPVESYAGLAVALREMGFDVVVSAMSESDALTRGVVAASDGAARSVVCDVAGLVALLRRADLFVGADSGPTHLAAALAVPTVALFGPTDPARNGPWGPGAKAVLRDPGAVTSYKRTAVSAMGKISVEQVAEAVRGLDFGERRA
jgi:heptosyltransferase-1